MISTKIIYLNSFFLSMIINSQVTVGEVKEKLSMVAEDNAKYGEV